MIEDADLLPSDADLDAELLEETPGWPKLVGILSIVFGGLSLTCNGANFAFLPFQKGLIEPLLDGDPPPPNMDLSPAMLAGGGLGLAWNALLVFAGVALLLRKPIARTTHLIYAVLSVPLTAFGLWMFMSMQADMAEWLKENPDNQFAQQQAQGGPIGLIIGLVFIVLSLGWPAFCAVWFGAIKRTDESMGAILGDEIA